MQNIIHAALLLGAALVAGPVRPADPADPQAEVPPLHYRPAFTPGYEASDGPADWRAANLAVTGTSAAAHEHGTSASAPVRKHESAGHDHHEARRGEDASGGHHGMHHGNGHGTEANKEAGHEHAH